MELAGRYAHAGRECVCERVRKIVGGSETTKCTGLKGGNREGYCRPTRDRLPR
jgi:hypothetical protein